MKFHVTYADGRPPVDVTPTPGDLVRFERKYGMAAGRIETDPRIEYVMFLAWTALTRTGQETLEFDEFLDVVDSTQEDVDPPLPPPD
jgi:hypothetical protein